MRLLHTMLRVTNLETSLKFYTDVLGMRLLRQKDYPDAQFTLAYLGYGDESETTVLELTHNWGIESYDMGTAYGHIAIEVENVYEAVKQVKTRGGIVTREAGPMKAGTTVLAFIKDPDGYQIELLGI